MTPVFLGLGANLGDPEASLRAAIAELAALYGPLEVAPLYRSAPLGDVPQPDFWNTAVRFAAAAPDLDFARRLLARAQALERAAGRVAGPRWGPRPLDVDVLLVGSWVHRDAELVVPHPELRRRAFVLRPLAALDPSLRLPPDGVAVASLLPTVADQRLVEAGWRDPPPGGTSGAGV